MICHFMTTKAFGGASEPGTLRFFSLIPISYLKVDD